MFRQIGTAELLIILFIVLLFVGGRKLPGLARSLGTSIGEFRKSTNEALDDDDDAPSEDDPGASSTSGDAATSERDTER